MNQYKVNFDEIQGDTPAPGVRSKVVVIHGKKIRLVEFTKEFIEPDWCKKGHIGYILEGHLEIDFNGNIVVFNPGDALCIPEGERHKHRAQTISDVVKIFLIDDI